MSINYALRPSKPVPMPPEEMQELLHVMEQDNSLQTDTKRKPDAIGEHGYRTEFEAKHMTYLLSHPKVNPLHYLANLRSMLRIRPRK